VIDRRSWSAAMLGGLALPAIGAAPEARGGGNILRVPFETAETGFDPAQVSDLYSARVIAHIFESPYCYDLLARPVKVRPRTAAALPETNADFTVWTVRLQPGIRFADDPAFGGRPRELVAQDYVYTFKRFADPATKSATWTLLEQEGLIGLDALREAALQGAKPFDYDTPIEGVRALDRHTLQFRLRAPRPRFIYSLCNASTYGAVAREVVEHYGAELMAHPVGTGPYRLKSWRRSSRIVLERNPSYREVLYDGEPAADDLQGQAWLARFKGRRLPLNDGVEIAVLEEGQARWLSFLNGIVDCGRVPSEFTHIAAPGGTLAPNLAKRRMELRRYVNPDFTMSWFNMDDPVVGGYTPDKVALRRAVELAYDIDREIRIIRRGSAVAAQAPMPPGTFGYDATRRTEFGQYDPARAKALLDLYGYIDRNGDGWRERPDGSPLVLHMATQSSNIERQFDENWQKSLAAIGVRIVFETAQWPENHKAARAGKLQMWFLGATAVTPDGQRSLEYMYGPSVGADNLARFRLPAFDAIYRRLGELPDGAERDRLFGEAVKLITAYMPYRTHVHRVYLDMNQPWVTGWRQAPFRNESWQFVEVDGALRERWSR
jgi:ABC-type transport system substrate-binding protein